MTAVLAIEDDGDTADLLRRALAGAGIDCAVTPTGGDGVRRAERQAPDVILLDLDLPDADGLELLPRLRDIAPVIVLTGRRSDDSVVTGLELGAEDYVTKPFSPRVLVARIAAVDRRRRGAAPPERIVHGALVIDPEQRTAVLGGTALATTRREFDLLVHLARRPGAVVSRDELLRSVWHSSPQWQTPATVTEHVRRLRRKLGDPAWIESVRSVGYRFTPQPPDAVGSRRERTAGAARPRAGR